MSSSANPQWNLAWRPASPEAGEALAQLQLHAVDMAWRQLYELGRMRAIGMVWVERLMGVLEGWIDPAFDPAFVKSRGFVPDFVKVARAVRQIIVLEQEVAGLRPARRRKPKDAEEATRPSDSQSSGSRGAKGLNWPLGPLADDTDDSFDYRPVGEAVGWIRETLDIETPADDPFREPKPRATEPEPAPEPADGPPVETDASEPEAAAQAPAPAATGRRAQGRAYDLDFRDRPGEDLRIARIGVEAMARGPP